MNTIPLDEDAAPAQNWRVDAMHEALRLQDTRTALLIREISRHAPGAEHMLFRVQRPHLLRFLGEKCVTTSLLHGHSLCCDAEENLSASSWAYLGWYRVEWNNHTLEIVLLPGSHLHESVLCYGSDARVLSDFVRALGTARWPPTTRSLRYSFEWEDAPDLDEEIGRVTWDDIILPAALIRNIRETTEGFVRHREAFKALQLIWKRGLLLIGPPGSGKTMIGKAVASALSSLPLLYVRDFHSSPGEDAITTIFARARELSPCLLVFEDIDGLVDGYNRTAFLNEMDGFGNNEGVLVLASSNHPERIHAALLKRPSRFDRVFHIALPATTERHRFARQLLGRFGDALQLDEARWERLCAQVAARSDGFTPAYLKEAFTGAAVRCASEGSLVCDERFAAHLLSELETLRSHLNSTRDAAALAEISPRESRMGLRYGAEAL